MRKPAALICLGLLLAFTSAAENPTYLPTRIVRQVDAGEGVVTNFISSYLYEGRVLTNRVSEQDLSGDGIMDRRTVATYSYDGDGNRVLSVFEEYSIPDGTLESRNRFTSSYDDKGNLLENLVESDSGGDGSIDYRSRITRTYDSEGKQIEQIEEFDLQADGTIDRSAKTTFTYDDRGNLVRRLIESDWDADGVVDGTSTYSRTYDRRDNLLLEVRTDGSDFTLTTRYTRDGRGNAIVTVVEIDWDGDGVVDETSTQTSTFNKRGQITSSITEYRDGEGLLYGTTKTSYTYDAHDNVIQVVREHDIEGDETPKEIDTATYTYTHVTGR
jgi:hypothetical protein